MNEVTDFEIEQKVGSIFMPHALHRAKVVRSEPIDFVHYTSVDAAIKMIKSKEVWLRNALVMNDFMEVQHGQEILASIWDDPILGGPLKAFLDSTRKGSAGEFERLFNDEQAMRRTQSFIFSMSEYDHRNVIEAKYGRLSMWRAYGGSPNVALVFSKTPFLSYSRAINAGSVPVHYADKDSFKAYFKDVADAVTENRDFLASFGSDIMIMTLRNYFSFYSLSLKHPGFSEEREWRVVSTPIFAFSDLARSRMKESVEVIGGIAQRVLKVKMENYPDEGFIGAELDELLKEVIIGPSENPWILYDAIVQVLRDEKVTNPEAKVRVSNIPLRR